MEFMNSNPTESLENKRSGPVAAINGTKPADSQPVRMLDNLQAVARKGQLGFVLQEGKQPAASTVSSINLITERAGTTAQTLQKPYCQRCDAYYHWGINE
jgi:hypothetical protein